MSSGPTIFHFNCPVCGTHPPQLLLLDYLDTWRASPQSDFEALLGTYRDILRTLSTSELRWKTKKFTKALLLVLDAFWNVVPDSKDNVATADQIIESNTHTTQCPLCHHEPSGEKKGPYFTDWDKACKVQVANVVYEIGIVIFSILRRLPSWASPRYLGDLGRLLLLNLKLLDAIGLMECPFCGRRTTCLYGDGSKNNPHRCRWCLDGEGGGLGIILQINEDLSLSLRPMTNQIPEYLSGKIVPRLRKGASRKR